MATSTASRTSTGLDAESFAAGDPVLNRLVQVTLWPLVMSAGFMAMLFVIRLLAAWRAGHHLSTDGVTGFLETPAQYTALVGGAVVLAYYIWIPKGNEMPKEVDPIDFVIHSGIPKKLNGVKGSPFRIELEGRNYTMTDISCSYDRGPGLFSGLADYCNTWRNYIRLFKT